MQESNISYEKDMNIYKQDMGFYSKFFDYLLYDFEDIQKTFGNVPSGVVLDESLQVRDKIIGITDYYGYKLVCIQDLEKFRDKFYVIQSAEIFNVNLKKKDYFCFVYRNIEGNLEFDHNLDLDDFYVSFDGDDFIVYNKVFDSQVFKKKLNLPSVALQGQKATTLKGWTDVGDLYFFPDWFQKDNKCGDILSLVKKFDSMVLEDKFMIEIQDYNDELYPLWRINIRVKETEVNTANLGRILALFMAYYPNQYTAYTIQNANIMNWCKYFLLINKGDINKVNIHFDLPASIMYYDESFMEFQQDFMRLKHGYYTLKENYNMLDSISGLETDNPHVQLSQSRMEMKKEAIGKMLVAYEKTFAQLVERLRVLLGDR